MVVISQGVTEALRYVSVIHDLSRLLACSIAACYVLLRSVTFCCGQLRFDQGVTRFFGLSRSATDET